MVNIAGITKFGGIIKFKPSNKVIPEYTQDDATTTDRAFNVGSESSINLGTRATQLASDGTYLFVSMRNGKGVQIRDLDTPTTLHTTIIPDGFVDGDEDHTVTNMAYGGGILAFSTYDSVYVYRINSHSDFTLLYEETVVDENMRACYVDYFGEWVYFGGFSGDIYAHEVGTSSYDTYSSFHSGEMRYFYAFNDNLISTSNDDTINRLDRSDRGNITSDEVLNHGDRIEVAWIDNEYIIFGSDSKTIEFKEPDDLSTSLKTITDPTDDVTSVVREFQYLSASTDSGQVFIFDLSNNFNKVFDVDITPGVESSLLKDGYLFYIDKNAVLHYRSYLNS